MIVGGYILDLYCDNKDKHMTLEAGRYYLIEGWIYIGNQFVGETYSECAREARQAGWLVNRTKDKCLCKYCKGSKK
jgi:hypothetical protein